MRTNLLMKLAASSMIVAGLTVAQNAYADSAPRAEKAAQGEAARVAARAEKLLDKDAVKALSAAEQAVALAPMNADFRMLLGRAYLENGRFRSAATSFGDVLTLDPSRGAAALSLALARIAVGDKDGARAVVDANADRIAAGDRGLALALTGDAPGGVAVLEAAVRAGGADAKTRQNLALAYAFAGRWVEAKLMASYDLDPATVSKRIMEWSRLAREDAGAVQVASLLGVQPRDDAGMPTQLALAPSAPATAPDVRTAAVTPPPPARIDDQAEFAAVAVATAPAAPAPATIVAAAPGISFAPRTEVVQPLPARTVAAAAPRTVPPAAARVQQAAYVVPTTGRFAVQIGAFSTAARVDTAWAQTVGRVGALARFTPARAVVRTPGGTFHRLSVTGFETRAAAVSLCGQLRARGGQCFVREVAGDAPLQWAVNRGPRIASR
jgi:Flp pilus assembly protein TadD